MESSLSISQAICINSGAMFFDKPFHYRIFFIGATHLIVLLRRQGML